jgi:hypothetical protein
VTHYNIAYTGHVPLPVIVRKVLADHAAATLGEFRPLMLAMLTACSHDTALYRSAATLLYEAARTAVRSRKSAAAAGIRVRAITTAATSNNSSDSTCSTLLCAETMAAIAATHGVVKVCANGWAAVEHIGESLSGTTTATAVHLWRLRAARQQQRLTRANSTFAATSNQHDSNSSSSAADNAVYAAVHKAHNSSPRAAAVVNTGGTAAVLSDAASSTNAGTSAGSNRSVSSGSAVQQQQQQSSWGVRGFLGAVPQAISGKLPLRMRGGSVSDK